MIKVKMSIQKYSILHVNKQIKQKREKEKNFMVSASPETAYKLSRHHHLGSKYISVKAFIHQRSVN